jgi:4-hydroxy-tetrahydrodipicolinate synthase
MAELKGVFAAAITPLTPDFSQIPEAIPGYLSFLSGRGCHGALLFGTTGEGPSFSSEQRRLMLQAAVNSRPDYPEFKLLAGTGTPSLDETILLTRAAFDLGMDGVVVLPPYYYRTAGQEGLFSWFKVVIERAVPADGALLIYHIPAMSGIHLSIELIARLKDRFPNQIAGIKDSSGDPKFAQELGDRFGDVLSIFNGNDRMFSFALRARASGCITAGANLISPDLRAIWDAYQSGLDEIEIQELVDQFRNILDKHAPFPPTIKAVLARCFGFPRWGVCPPLTPLSAETEEELSSLLLRSGVKL